MLALLGVRYIKHSRTRGLFLYALAVVFDLFNIARGTNVVEHVKMLFIQSDHVMCWRITKTKNLVL